MGLSRGDTSRLCRQEFVWCRVTNCQVPLQMTFLPQWVCEVGKVVSEYLPEPKREKHYEEVRKICCKGEV